MRCDATSFAHEMEAVYEAGASILGGCCGTTPEHIGNLPKAISWRRNPPVDRRPDGIRYLTSERKTVVFRL